MSENESKSCSISTKKFRRANDVSRENKIKNKKSAHEYA